MSFSLKQRLDQPDILDGDTILSIDDAINALDQLAKIRRGFEQKPNQRLLAYLAEREGPLLTRLRSPYEKLKMLFEFYKGASEPLMQSNDASRVLGVAQQYLSSLDRAGLLQRGQLPGTVVRLSIEQLLEQKGDYDFLSLQELKKDTGATPGTIRSRLARSSLITTRDVRLLYEPGREKYAVVLYRPAAYEKVKHVVLGKL